MGVSVILTVRGSDRFLEGAVLTVCQQVFRPIELVLVDDGIQWRSTSASVLQGLTEKHNVQLTFVSPKRRGRAMALNAGLHSSTHDLVAILDVDDRWQRMKLAIQVPHADATSIIGTDILTVIGNGEDIDFAELDESKVEVTDISTEVLRHCPLTHSSVLIPRALISTSVGGYNENLGSQLDWDLFARAVMRGAALRKIKARLTAKRQHLGQSFEARDKLGYLARSASLQWHIQRKMKAPFWYFYFILRRSLIWALPRRLKWRLQSVFGRRAEFKRADR